MISGASAIIHVAAILGFNTDPNEVIPQTVKSVQTALTAAMKEPTVKHFVYTSSAIAADEAKADIEYDITPDSWNEESVRLAWNPTPEAVKSGMQGPNVYAASKVAAEKEIFKFGKRSDINFTVNTVIPYTTWGPILDPVNQGPRTSANLLTKLYTEGFEGIGFFQHLTPVWANDVRDVGRLHVAPLLDSNINGERIFAYSETARWNQVLAIFREIRPNRQFVEDNADKRQNLTRITTRWRTEEILQKYFGREGLIGLREMVEAGVAHLD